MKTLKQSIADSPESHDFALDALLERAALADPIDAQAYARLEARVLTQSLPPQSRPFVDTLIDSLIEWFAPHPQLRWRSVMAATCPILLGIVIGNFYHFGVATPEPYDALANSWDDEFAMLSYTEVTTLELDSGASL